MRPHTGKPTAKHSGKRERRMALCVTERRAHCIHIISMDDTLEAQFPTSASLGAGEAQGVCSVVEPTMSKLVQY